ncbi:hypothetical protein U0027_23640 [Agrobacterium tumefaciens]|uniref:hypothetical protein n=1 Tax=Agrobacterium tumefaciens TaxID=358 RepID=UPI000E0C65EC|nr:hypothetical protein [Agrobacterium tumefaciens]WQE43176.1 hypothetical protein U0027_23640 [Agrobacterium tumefaciens]
MIHAFGFEANIFASLGRTVAFNIGIIALENRHDSLVPAILSFEAGQIGVASAAQPIQCFFYLGTAITISGFLATEMITAVAAADESADIIRK